MKVILTGSTGFIGAEVLSQCLASGSIDEVICLSRRALPEPMATNFYPKLKVLILKDEDFLEYNKPKIWEMCAGAEACIWSMGAPPAKNTASDLELCKKVEIEYTRAAAEAFVSSLLPALEKVGKKFRFVYLSAMFANRETEKKTWFLNDTRTNKGTAENGLLAVSEKNKGFEVTVVRPGGVLAKGNSMLDFMVNIAMSVRIEELTAVMVDEIVGGVEGTRTLENVDLRKKGKELLKG